MKAHIHTISANTYGIRVDGVGTMQIDTHDALINFILHMGIDKVVIDTEKQKNKPTAQRLTVDGINDSIALARATIRGRRRHIIVEGE